MNPQTAVNEPRFIVAPGNVVTVVLAAFLLPVVPLLGMIVGWLAYLSGTSVRSEEALTSLLAVFSAIGVGYSIAKAIWPTLP